MVIRGDINGCGDQLSPGTLSRMLQLSGRGQEKKLNQNIICWVSRSLGFAFIFETRRASANSNPFFHILAMSFRPTHLSVIITTSKGDLDELLGNVQLHRKG